MNKEFKRMQELAGLTEIKVNRPRDFYFTHVDDGLEYRRINSSKSYFAPWWKGDDDIYFNLSIDANYEDIEFLEDDPEQLILAAPDLDPNFDVIFFESFINDLNKAKIPFDFYYEKDGGYVYPTVTLQYDDIKNFIKK
jgi:hypothetical protein